MRLPNLLIAGAPKCGTSSLFGWLCAHPNVAGSTIKETRFLLDRGHPLFHPTRNVHDQGIEAYADYFPEDGEKAGASVRLEGTTHYLYQRTAPKVLGALDPLPHVVFLLRKPSERVYSSFRYAQHNLGHLPPDLTFREFLRLGDGTREPDPRWGGRLEIWRNDVAYSRYADYLANWAEEFPRERLHVFLFEELRSDPSAVLGRISKAVGIDPSFYDGYGFPKQNESYRVKSLRVQRLARAIGAWVPTGSLRASLRKGYMRVLTSAGAEGNDDDLAVLRELDQEFRPHNERLAREWGVDVSPWRSGG